MSAASTMLEIGRLALVAHHGESLTWIPASVVQVRENGEVIIGNDGKALYNGDESNVEFTAVFDNAYASINAEDGSIASTGPAVTNVSTADLPDLSDRGDLILRGSEQFFVQRVEPDGVGVVNLILSKHAH